jgi:cobalt/nickel transport system permease protein
VSSVATGLSTFDRLDRLAAADSPIHRVDPRAKVLATAVFIVCVVSFGKYDVIGLLPFALFPVVMASRGGLPLRFIGRLLLIASPFALVVGVFNPLLDRDVIGQIAGVDVTGGWVSYLSIVLRFLLTASAAFVLTATTSFNGVCAALERLGVPDVLVTQLLLLYRYIFVLADETLRMARARALRACGRRGTGMRVYAQMLGSLLLRSFARAQRVYLAMKARGFDGRVRVPRRLDWQPRDTVFLVGWSAAFLVFRFADVGLTLGRLVTGDGS